VLSGLYQAIFVTPWAWWAGGLAIGLLVPSLYYYQNVALGVSTGYGNLLKLLWRGKKPLKWLEKDSFKDPWGWRVFFIAGMIIGAFLSARLSGRPLLTGEMGVLTSSTSWPAFFYGLILFTGGTLLGLGARIAGGCTSGHSIHGLATLQLSSLVVTIGFIVMGALSTYLVRFLLLGGVTP